jgi:hypothetical protein
VRFAYAAAGYTLVADHRLAGLDPCADGPAEITIHVGAAPSWANQRSEVIHESPYHEDNGQPLVKVARGDCGVSFQYADDCRFWVAADASAVWMTFPGTLEDACTYLVGPVLSAIIRLRHEFSLHASAVVIDECAVALCGPHGAGKSTAAASFGLRGRRVITDDVLRLSRSGERWMAQPFGGMLRLWPDGAATAFSRETELPPITPTWNKRALQIGGAAIAGAPQATPLNAIVFLVFDETLGPAHAVRTLPPSEVAVRLAANSSASHLLDAEGRAREFTQVTAIAASCAGAEWRRGPGAPIDDGLSAVSEWVRASGCKTACMG